ncbi:IclR family transcriptional regulator [Tuberibacillus sp. Marseille-P3662]|uniref:IclR family transcriptional regulator n=1 Tax=Tuberibacillus sp. Marseille-P3662 TaxID=1965358 RepID=UPI000A1C968D|nr:IclR family transcriptional regulator [Tuberibacillus sp. Marseille-P3662]
MAVKSAVRVLDMFELLVHYPEGLTMNDIAERLSLPQSSTFHLVRTLADYHYLIQTDLKTFKLGPKLIQVGTKALESIDINAEAGPELRRLMETVEETVFMAVLLDRELVYISKVDNHRSVRTSAQIGARKPLYCTGLGKAFLAYLPDDIREDMISESGQPAVTPNTITDAYELKTQLMQYRQQGYAIDDEESEEGLYCLAAPVFNVEGRMEAAISVAGPKDRVFSRKASIVNELKSTAEAISYKLGYETIHS